MSKQYLVVEHATALFYYKVTAESLEEAKQLIDEGYSNWYTSDYIDREVYKVEELKYE